MSIALSSPGFDDRDVIPDRYARLGENVSPPLAWSGVPTGTIELVLLVEDPDAPAGIFTHWIVAGLAPELEGLDEGEIPPGAIEGSNDFGEDGWGGPQPPAGDPPHHYVFILLALGEPSELAEGSSSDDVRDAVRGKELGQGQLTGLYAA